MKPVDLLNAGALLLALGLALGGAALAGRPSSPRRAQAVPAAAPAPAVVRDARGREVPAGDFRRIASLGIESDALLAELCAPERIAAISAYGAGAHRARLGAKPQLAGLTDLEALIALAPDLVLVSTVGDQLDRLARLQEAGLTVFDLGAQRGTASLLPNARRLAALLGDPQRGERWAAAFARRLAAVAAHLPPGQARRRACYVTGFGDELYGGTVGTSFHDVLVAAGLVDVAAERFRDWPRLSIELLIALDPDVLVTNRGAGAALRRLPGAEAVRALREPGGVLELDAALLQDPTLGMLDAAEALVDLAYPAVGVR
jgi:iron complex transport system substrate-binding protein